MTNSLNVAPPTLTSLTFKAVIIHTVTYFVAGILAYTFSDYEKTFSEPPFSHFAAKDFKPEKSPHRKVDDPPKLPSKQRPKPPQGT